MKTKGFTLVELLVVIAILAILATVSVVGYTSFIERAEESNAATEAHQVESAIESFLMIDGEYVFTENTVVSGNTTTTTKIVAAKQNDGTVVINERVIVDVKDDDSTADVDETSHTDTSTTYNDFITLPTDSDFYELPGKLYSDNGTLLYVYEDAGVAGDYEADKDSAVEVFAN
ncbi:MAG: type II secretion system protein [Clostridia bacterium]|nr:type II secretion system protein [Clostridia bacterium]